MAPHFNSAGAILPDKPCKQLESLLGNFLRQPLPFCVAQQCRAILSGVASGVIGKLLSI
jgi:hypothetical protein